MGGPATLGDFTDAVFPAVPNRRGHYESYYLRATAPGRAAAVWIRYTVHKRPGAPALGSLWCTLWAGPGATPHAVKETLPGPRADGWISLGEAHFGPGRARGTAQAQGHVAGWDLTFDAGVGAVEHLPARFMYRAALPRTKTLSPVSDARFHGWVEVDGERVELDGWRGMTGHNWGAEHAERWIWLHGLGFAEDERAWVDVVVGRVRAVRLTTPWIANGVMRLGDGTELRVGGLSRPGDTEVRDAPTAATLSLPAGRATLDLVVRSPPSQVVAWLYADPAGGSHHALHCSVAAMEARVVRPGREPIVLTTAHGACYEVGLREGDHGIALQPYPDG